VITTTLKGTGSSCSWPAPFYGCELSKKSLSVKFDFVFIALTVIAVNRLH